MVVSTTLNYYSLARRRVVPAYIHVERCWPKVDKLSPCEAGCPLYVDIPNFVQAIAMGDFQKANAVVREKNPLPSICGHVCWHPCEDECNRDVLDKPIAIQWLECFAAEKGSSEKPLPAARTKEEKVAVIGSGPAGLTAASDLVRKGYGVTVFEASSIPGGMPATVIPNFMLPGEAIRADISYLEALGIKIHTNLRVGKDFTLASLRQQGFKATLIACGAERNEGAKIPGANLAGVLPVMTFLQDVKMDRRPLFSGKVWVIGGDSIAIAAARTALRLGASEVHLACLEARGDRSQPGNIPAPAWELEAAEREGVQIEPSLVPQEFTAKTGSKISGITFKRVVPLTPGVKGKIYRTVRGFPLVEMEGPDSVYSVKADTVIYAAAVFQAKRHIPELGDLLGVPDGKGKAVSLQVNKDTFETNVPGVFAVGDRTGTGSHIVEAMAEGRTAAVSIDQYLSGQYIIPLKESRVELTIKPEQVPAYLTRKPRWEMPRLLPVESVKTFEGVELGYKEWQAMEEARRCLNCRMCANCIFERGHICKETGRRLLV